MGVAQMENAQLIGLSRHIALQRQMDVVANNVANINTAGFKAQSLLFEEYIMPVASYEEGDTGLEQLSYTQDWATVSDFSEGAVMQTGNPLDVALQGEGFLTVSTPDGERWTRTGTLKLDGTGLLVTNEGYPVLSEGGEIRFGPTDTNIMIDANGAITTDAGNKGTLRLVEFDEPLALVREGDNLFSGGTPAPATATSVVQGAVERSNVSGVKSIAELVRVQRAYETIASMLQRQDELREQAISTLGRLSS